MPTTAKTILKGHITVMWATTSGDVSIPPAIGPKTNGLKEYTTLPGWLTSSGRFLPLITEPAASDIPGLPTGGIILTMENDLTELCHLAIKYGTDRHPLSKHSYTPYYFNLFKDKRQSVKKVLEIGVGNGKNINSILKQNPKSIAAIDISQEALSSCKLLFPNLELIKSDITQTNFKDGEFDVILCYYILNNLLEKDRKKTIKEVYRILSSNGLVLFEDFMQGDHRQKSDSTKTTEKNTIIRTSGLIQHFFTKEEAKRLFSAFKGVKIKTKSFNTISLKPNLKRKLISLVAKK